MTEALILYFLEKFKAVFEDILDKSNNTYKLINNKSNSKEKLYSYILSLF